MIEECAHPGSELQSDGFNKSGCRFLRHRRRRAYIPKEVFMANMGKAIEARFDDTAEGGAETSSARRQNRFRSFSE